MLDVRGGKYRPRRGIGACGYVKSFDVDDVDVEPFRLSAIPDIGMGILHNHLLDLATGCKTHLGPDWRGWSWIATYKSEYAMDSRLLGFMPQSLMRVLVLPPLSLWISCCVCSRK